mmetsp:Transcript_35718/g.57387  ORF Transcript_35718/g.57387 Transcript_35718/m.57387 type:complete len:267 (+) Transcript_35718:754-1554(+)
MRARRTRKVIGKHLLCFFFLFLFFLNIALQLMIILDNLLLIRLRMLCRSSPYNEDERLIMKGKLSNPKPLRFDQLAFLKLPHQKLLIVVLGHFDGDNLEVDIPLIQQTVHHLIQMQRTDIKQMDHFSVRLFVIIAVVPLWIEKHHIHRTALLRSQRLVQLQKIHIVKMESLATCNQAMLCKHIHVMLQCLIPRHIQLIRVDLVVVSVEHFGERVRVSADTRESIDDVDSTLLLEILAQNQLDGRRHFMRDRVRRDKVRRIAAESQL